MGGIRVTEGPVQPDRPHSTPPPGWGYPPGGDPGQRQGSGVPPQQPYPTQPLYPSQQYPTQQYPAQPYPTQQQYPAAPAAGSPYGYPSVTPSVVPTQPTPPARRRRWLAPAFAGLGVAVVAGGAFLGYSLLAGGGSHPADVLPAIFEPLVRAPNASAQSTDRSKTSLGLGLFIVREIVIGHGGTIEVQSSAEGGTVFSVRLPRSAQRSG